MVDLYLDNDISLQLVPLLQGAGRRVATARDEHRTRATDDEHLLVALQHRWILVTHNRNDYTLLHDFLERWPATLRVAMPTHAGILVLDQSPPMDLFRAMQSILVSSGGSGLAGQLLWWRPVRGWNKRVAGTGWVSLG